MLFYFTIFWFFDKWLKDWLRLDIIKGMNSLKNRKCDHCKKPLKVIGNQRKNGINNVDDWKFRPMHKKCLYELKEINKIKDIIEANKPKENELTYICDDINCGKGYYCGKCN